jgi:RimJ/RimL family protein N-acetyltransferase
VRTERLVLETLTVDEARAIAEGDRVGRAWADDYPSEGDVVVARLILEATDDYDELAPLGALQVRLADDGRAVGGIGFVSAPDAEGAAEVGYGLVPSVRRQGLATEALRAVCDWAGTAGVVTVIAMTDPDNVASHGVLRRVGFTRDGEEATHDGLMWRWRRSVQPFGTAVSGRSTP